MPFLLIGVVQILWILPALVVLACKERHDLTLGVVLGGAATFMLNAGCGLAMAAMYSAG